MRKTSAQRGYGSAWQRARKAYLLAHPLCVMCQEEGRTTPAEVVDHVIPHKGDPDLFWDQENWQALCKRHHDAAKQMEDKGDVIGCDITGIPIDPDHPWSK